MSAGADAEHNRRHWDALAGDYQREHGETVGGAAAGRHRFVDATDDTVLFMLPDPRTIAALRDAGLLVESLLELQPPAGATSTFRPHPDELAWARRWPMEEIWRARKP